MTADPDLFTVRPRCSQKSNSNRPKSAKSSSINSVKSISTRSLGGEENETPEASSTVVISKQSSQPSMDIIEFFTEEKREESRYRFDVFDSDDNSQESKIDSRASDVAE